MPGITFFTKIIQYGVSSFKLCVILQVFFYGMVLIDQLTLEGRRQSANPVSWKEIMLAICLDSLYSTSTKVRMA
jgi:hypothetical protein